MSRVKLAGVPYLVFLLVCVVYLAFPSNHFNADALHYNLLAFMSLDDPSVVLRDEAVSVHPLWHLMATSVLWIAEPSSPERSLYVLRAVNIVLALGAIFLFMRLALACAGEWAAAWATLILAFSQACLRNFLAVEVYALNNLLLILVLLLVHRATRAGMNPGAGTAAIFALMSMVAIGAHLANVLLVIPVTLFLLWRSREGGRTAVVVYPLCLCLLAAIGVGALAWLSGRDLPGTLSYLMAYSGKKTTYLSSDILQNLSVSFWSIPEAIMARGGVLLYVPAGLLVGLTARHWEVVWKDLWARFLIVYLGLMLALVTQWDPDNIEHKIACIPVMLLLVTRVHTLVVPRPRAAQLAGAGLIAAAVVVCGLLLGVRPYTRLADYPPYMQSAQIRRQSRGNDVVLTLSPGQTADSVTLAAMTFFGQRVIVLDMTEAGALARIEAYKARGFDVVSH